MEMLLLLVLSRSYKRRSLEIVGEVFVASNTGDVGTIEIKYKSNPKLSSEVDIDGNTALHIAAREGHFSIIDFILKNTKSANSMCRIRNDLGNTALHEAVEGGNPDIVRILLKYNQGAAKIRNGFGETALLLASKYGHVEAARDLLKVTPTASILWPSNKRQTCLHVAAYGEHIDVVTMILDKASCCNILHSILFIHDAYGATPMHTAIHGGHLDIVHVFGNISRCNLSSMMKLEDKYGRCPIHVAVMKGRGDIVEEIMSSSIPQPMDILNKDFKTILHFAVEHNQFQIVQKLLSNKKPEKVVRLVSYDCDSNGNTALHFAAMNGVHPKLVEYLLSFPGVNVNAVNNEGLTAIDMAAAIATSQDKPNYATIAEILKDAGATPSCFIQRSTSSRWHSKPSEQKRGADSKVMKVNTLVASLIATVTFAAIFQVPGGIEDDKHSVHYGAAKYTLNGLFQVFLFCDILALFTSLVVVIAWIFHEQLQRNRIADHSRLADVSAVSLVLSVVCTGLAFVSATALVTSPHNVKDLKTHDKELFQTYDRIVSWEFIAAALPAAVAMYVTLILAIYQNFRFHFKAANQFIVSDVIRKPLLIVTIFYSAICCLSYYMGKEVFHDLH